MDAASSSQMVVQDQDSPIRGDILEAILSHAPLTDLVAASHVSKAWRHAVISSPPLLNILEPWLLLHHTRNNNNAATTTTTHAYDSRSHLWIETKLHAPSIECNSNTAVLRSSHSNLLYTLSPSKLSFSFDPLHLTWHHADGPTIWRTNPVVALVGRRLVVAGGGCNFEDDPLAVEAYDIDSLVWTTREPMPAGFKDSASSTWLSTAVHNRILFVTEKHSGVTHAFDPEINIWCGPYDMRPDPSVFSVAVTCFDDRLIIVGLIGEAENVEGVRVWGVKICESFKCELIGEMPSALVEKLRSGSYWVSSVGVCLAGYVLYIYNQAMVEEIFTCEFVGNGGGCRWASVRNVRSAMERVVFTCSEVGIREVHKALAAETRRFTAELTQVDK